MTTSLLGMVITSRSFTDNSMETGILLHFLLGSEHGTTAGKRLQFVQKPGKLVGVTEPWLAVWLNTNTAVWSCSYLFYWGDVHAHTHISCAPRSETSQDMNSAVYAFALATCALCSVCCWNEVKIKLTHVPQTFFFASLQPPFLLCPIFFFWTSPLPVFPSSASCLYLTLLSFFLALLFYLFSFSLPPFFQYPQPPLLPSSDGKLDIKLTKSFVVKGL